MLRLDSSELSWVRKLINNKKRVKELRGSAENEAALSEEEIT